MKQMHFQSNNVLNVYDDGSFDLKLDQTGIYQCRPTLDGECPSSIEAVKSTDTEISITYGFSDCELELTFSGTETGLTIKPSLLKFERSKLTALSVIDHAFLVNFDNVLVHGYFSWDKNAFLSAGQIK